MDMRRVTFLFLWVGAVGRCTDHDCSGLVSADSLLQRITTEALEEQKGEHSSPPSSSSSSSSSDSDIVEAEDKLYDDLFGTIDRQRGSLLQKGASAFQTHGEVVTAADQAKHHNDGDHNEAGAAVNEPSVSDCGDHGDIKPPMLPNLVDCGNQTYGNFQCSTVGTNLVSDGNFDNLFPGRCKDNAYLAQSSMRRATGGRIFTKKDGMFSSIDHKGRFISPWMVAEGDVAYGRMVNVFSFSGDVRAQDSFLHLCGAGKKGIIQQTIRTVPGTAYELSFLYAAHPEGGKRIQKLKISLKSMADRAMYNGIVSFKDQTTPLVAVEATADDKSRSCSCTKLFGSPRVKTGLCSCPAWLRILSSDAPAGRRPCCYRYSRPAWGLRKVRFNAATIWTVIQVESGESMSPPGIQACMLFDDIQVIAIPTPSPTPSPPTPSPTPSPTHYTMTAPWMKEDDKEDEEDEEDDDGKADDNYDYYDKNRQGRNR